MSANVRDWAGDLHACGGQRVKVVDTEVIFMAVAPQDLGRGKMLDVLAVSKIWRQEVDCCAVLCDHGGGN